MEIFLPIYDVPTITIIYYYLFVHLEVKMTFIRLINETILGTELKYI